VEPATHLAAIATELAKKSTQRVFVVLHGIDGKGLRGRASQVVFFAPSFEPGLIDSA
jgi:hypothetical protein